MLARVICKAADMARPPSGVAPFWPIRGRRRKHGGFAVWFDRVSLAADLGKAAMTFGHLLSPFTVGNVTIRNRAFSSAHGTGFGQGGALTDRHLEYHRARARGGIGLIVLEATSVDNSPIGVGTGGANLRNTSNAVLPQYHRIAEAVHDEGAK